MTERKFKGKNNVTQIKTYTIDTSHDNIVGKGSYGVLYRATDVEGQTIAAKTINTKKYPKILTRDYSKFTELNHENVVRIYDVDQQDDTFWMFMICFKIRK